MLNKMRNRFLIIGLTGPLGSGCTSSARFLSGETIGGTNIFEKLKDEIKIGEELNGKITRRYKKIDSLKNSIHLREHSSKLGPYKNQLTNPSEDPKILEYEREAQYAHNSLKINLKRREIVETLKDFLGSNAFTANSINSHDNSVFGAKPFFYISLSMIIIKKAFEAYSDQGEISFTKYFERKMISARDNRNEYQEIEFENLLNLFRDMFTIPEADARKFIMTNNNFINSRFYLRHTIYNEIKGGLSDSTYFEKTNNLLQEKTSTYYEYLKFLKKVLSGLKKATPATKNSLEFHSALSELMQDWGDNIRDSGNPFIGTKSESTFSSHHLYSLSQEINTMIKFLRFRIRYLDKYFKLLPEEEFGIDNPTLFVVECFRNPYEVDYFRSRYSEFYLISIGAPKDIRKERVGTNNFSEERDARDQGRDWEPKQIHKLDVRACVFQSDIALLNKNKNIAEYFKTFLRYIALISNPGCITPNSDEYYMHIACSSSLMSSCISRKVGAVIVGPKGYIYGVGWNDVSEGQIGCGLRTKNDILSIDEIPKINNNNQEYFANAIKSSQSDHVCYKDCLSKMTMNKALNHKNDSSGPKTEKGPDCVSKIAIKRMEYCRALHAEENAILQLSKIGGVSIKNCILYTTTFPCELCSKKIYQTGIRTVYYLEPYPESFGEQLILNDGNRNIEIIPFQGVKSNSYFKLFRPIFDKKELDIMKTSNNINTRV